MFSGRLDGSMSVLAPVPLCLPWNPPGPKCFELALAMLCLLAFAAAASRACAGAFKSNLHNEEMIHKGGEITGKRRPKQSGDRRKSLRLVLCGSHRATFAN